MYINRLWPRKQAFSDRYLFFFLIQERMATDTIIISIEYY